MASRKCGVARERAKSRSLDDTVPAWDFDATMNAVYSNVNAIRDQVTANNQAIANAATVSTPATAAPGRGSVHAADTTKAPSAATARPTTTPPAVTVSPVSMDESSWTSGETISPANHSSSHANAGSTSGSGVAPAATTVLPTARESAGTTAPLSSTTTISAQSGSPAATVIGVSLGAVATLAIVVAVVLYVHRHRKQLNATARQDKHDERMRSNPTGTTNTMTTYVSDGGKDNGFTSPWDVEALLAVRVPLDAIHKGELVSQGGFGEVYRGRYVGEDVAIKTLLPPNRKNTGSIKTFQSEIKLMAALEHPHIVHFVGVGWESLSDLCVLTEFMAGGDLRSLLQSFDKCEPRRPRGFDSDKLKIALHVAHALVYLHTLDHVVVHRDLKSRNILLDAEWNAKLTDFGVSRERSEETMTAGIGSMLWMAPEVMLGERYDVKTDIFSFGIVLSELDTQQLPYAKERDAGRAMQAAILLRLVSLGQMSISLTESPAYRKIQELARRCVALDPRSRPIHLSLTE